MSKFACLVALFLVPFNSAFIVNHRRSCSSSCLSMALEGKETSRRELLQKAAVGFLVGFPAVVNADVSEGNTLPQGVLQFNRAIRLKRDIKSVTKRVKENASEIDAEEWNNISKFLRTAYSTGEDLKVVAAGIKTPANKQRALDDIEQLKKYAQAGDIPVSKKDADGFVAVSTKMLELMNDYFDALIDVPDEI